MTLVLIIDVLAIGLLFATTLTKGFERTLPVAAFLMMLFPMESQIPLPGLFDLTTQRLIVIALIVLYIFFGGAPGKIGQNKKLPLKLLVLALMAWMLLSAANSVVLSVSLKSTLSQFLDFFVTYYIFVKTVSKAETISRILLAFVAAMFICSIFGAVEAYRGWSVISLFPRHFHRFAYLAGEMDRGVRTQSTFGHPILFGATLAMAIPMALFLVTMAKTTARKAFLWSAILLMFLNIYKTSSRGPWLALIFSLVLLFLLDKNQMRRYLTVITLLMITILVVRPGIWGTIRNLYMVTLDPDTAQGESYQWRYALYHITFLHLNGDFGRAMWGYGPESFFFLGWEGDFQGQSVKYESCDSSVAALMAETGYVGFAIVAVLLLKVAFVTFRGFRRMPSPANSLCLVLFVNICAFCFMMTNVAILGWGQQNYLLWILIAIAVVYPTLALPETISPETRLSSDVLFSQRRAEVFRS